MGWKIIKGRSYYYRSNRKNGRHVTEYVGCERTARAESIADQDDRIRRGLDRVENRKKRDADVKLDNQLNANMQEAEAFAADFLEANGCHNHKGQWRHKRTKGETMTTKKPAPGKQLATIKAEPASLSTRQRAGAGPIDLWAFSMVAAKLAGGHDKAMHAKLMNDILDHAESLAGQTPTPIEMTLAESAALSHALSRYYEVSAAMAEGSIEQSSHLLAQAAHSHRRFCTALKTLAQVRRLTGPSVQVVNNGGRNQTNIIGTPASGSNQL